MRTFLLTLAAFGTAASPSLAATRNFGITSFAKVRVDGPFKVRLATGVAPFASATGSPQAIDRVAIDVRGDTLVVHSNLDAWGGYPGESAGPVEINLGTHDLNAAWLNGSGALAIDKVEGLSFDLSVQGSGAASIDKVDVDQLKLSVAGTGSANVAGQTRKMTALVRGISSLEASNLTAKDATIGAEGTATVDANVLNSASIDGTGAITIRLTGDPACTLRVNGSGSVSGCKSSQ
jgi:hypothetical protein